MVNEIQWWLDYHSEVDVAKLSDSEVEDLWGELESGPAKERVFRLQIYTAMGWLNVNDDFKARLPHGEDVLTYVRNQYPSVDFRVVYVKKGQD